MQKLSEDEQHSNPDMTLYDRYGPVILAYIYRHISNVQDAEDLLLEVFLAALKSEQFGGLEERQQMAWLQRVARNKVIDRYRHNSRVTMLPLENAMEVLDERLTPEQHVVQKEAYERLHSSVAQLSPIQQQVIRLRFGNHLRLTEIAALLGKPEGSVRKLLLRTLRHLRDIYEQR